jgi:hypothetical protein
MGDLVDYLAGDCEPVWNRLCDLETPFPAPRLAEARAVARETMTRVRRNIEILIARWRKEGYRFGYHWAGAWAAQDIAQAPPLLGNPNAADIRVLDDFEKQKGPIPVALRAFYEVVGAVNFVGNQPPGWPNKETLDPLQVELFTPQFNRLILGDENDPFPTDAILCPDPLLKFFIGGVGPLTVEVPSTVFDPPIRFEYEDLHFNDEVLTFGGMLREIILKRGGIGLAAGFDDDTPDSELIRRLTEGLIPF